MTFIMMTLLNKKNVKKITIFFYRNEVSKATFVNTKSKRCKTKDNKTNKKKLQVKVNGVWVSISRVLDLVHNFNTVCNHAEEHL